MQLLRLLSTAPHWALGEEKAELCKSWPDAHIWQQSPCLVSRQLSHGRQLVCSGKKAESMKASTGPCGHVGPPG